MLHQNPAMISIIIPSLNQGRCLTDTLRSILDQPFRDLEVIVIDGGSDDNSLQILKSVAASDRRLRCSSGRDRGAGYGSICCLAI